jgi:type IV secretory pathway TrbD component
MRNMLYGTLCGALVFGALSWATTRKTVHAAVLTAPPEGRTAPECRYRMVRHFGHRNRVYLGLHHKQPGRPEDNGSVVQTVP